MKLLSSPEGIQNIRQHLKLFGILCCTGANNIPGLEDIGARWGDMIALMEKRELFYTKAFKGRSAYLSPEVYRRLKACRQEKPIPPEAERVYAVLQAGPAEMNQIKKLAGIESREYNKGMQFLLRNLAVTAIGSGQILSENWSSYLYGTSWFWEQAADRPPVHPLPQDLAEEWIREMLGQSLAQQEIDRLMGGSVRR